MRTVSLFLCAYSTTTLQRSLYHISIFDLLVPYRSFRIVSSFRFFTKVKLSVNAQWKIFSDCTDDKRHFWADYLSCFHNSIWNKISHNYIKIATYLSDTTYCNIFIWYTPITTIVKQPSTIVKQPSRFVLGSTFEGFVIIFIEVLGGISRVATSLTASGNCVQNISWRGYLSDISLKL